MLKIGDAVEKVAKPIAKALKMNCLDGAGNLKPESKCAKRKAWLNNLTAEKKGNMNNPQRPQIPQRPAPQGPPNGLIELTVKQSANGGWIVLRKSHPFEPLVYMDNDKVKEAFPGLIDPPITAKA